MARYDAGWHDRLATLSGKESLRQIHSRSLEAADDSDRPRILHRTGPDGAQLRLHLYPRLGVDVPRDDACYADSSDDSIEISLARYF